MCEPLSSCSMDFARQALTGPGSNPCFGGSPSSKLTWFAKCLGTLLPSTPCHHHPPPPPHPQPHHHLSQSTPTTTIDETSRSVADTRLPQLVATQHPVIGQEGGRYHYQDETKRLIKSQTRTENNQIYSSWHTSLYYIRRAREGSEAWTNRQGGKINEKGRLPVSQVGEATQKTTFGPIPPRFRKKEHASM